MEEDTCGRDKFPECIKWRIRYGERIGFWEDMWIEGEVLKDIFPHIFVIFRDKDISGKKAYRDRAGGRV